MFKKILLMNTKFLLIISLFLIFSCKEDAVVEPEPIQEISILSPNGGEIFYADDLNIPIKWSQKNIKQIDILYSIDYLGDWILVNDSIDTSYETYFCKFPNVIADSIKLRIRDSKDENVFDDSDAFFSILKENPDSIHEVSVLSPNGGEIFYANPYLYIPVKWAQKNVEKIDILYSMDYLNNWKVIGDHIPANLEIYSCSFQNVIADSIRLRIRDSYDENIFDDSDKFFSIIEDDPYNLNKVEILTPGSGDFLTGTDKYLVTWSNPDLLDIVDLYFSSDNGSNWEEIFVYKNIPSGNYEWLVPNIGTSSAKLKLTAIAGNKSRQIESSTFSIHARQRDQNALAYFPIKIGDVRVYNREEIEFGEADKLSKVKQIVKNDTLLNGKKYFVFESEIRDLQNYSISKLKQFYRVDTLTNIVYRYISNSESVFLNLELFPSETFDIDSEHYVTLVNEEREIAFGNEINSKNFSRRDIYGYTSNYIKLLENIGSYVDYYYAEAYYSRKDIMLGAVLDGIVYGDTTFVRN